MPEIAAIICTHNREQYLGAAIDSLLNQDYDDYEVLVIDNASSDRTSEIVKSKLSNPKLRYIYEPELGLSVARNRGAKETKASILAYLDDDAVATPQWLRTLIEVYNKYPQLAIAGGKVTLIFPEGKTQPPWMSDELTGNLGFYNLGDQLTFIDQPSLTPRGLNYSIRSDFLETVGGFDINLGRKGKNLLSNEELYMTELALKQGWQVAYIPDALVAHNVSLERLQPNWFFQRSWWQGVSEYYRDEMLEISVKNKLMRGGERLIRGIYKSVKYITNPALRFDNLLYAYCQLSYLGLVLKNSVKKN